MKFPPGIPRRARTAFGRNGKGRHAGHASYLLTARRLIVAKDTAKHLNRDRHEAGGRLASVHDGIDRRLPVFRASAAFEPVQAGNYGPPHSIGAFIPAAQRIAEPVQQPWRTLVPLPFRPESVRARNASPLSPPIGQPFAAFSDGQRTGVVKRAGMSRNPLRRAWVPWAEPFPVMRFVCECSAFVCSHRRDPVAAHTDADFPIRGQDLFLNRPEDLYCNGVCH